MSNWDQHYLHHGLKTLNRGIGGPVTFDSMKSGPLTQLEVLNTGLELTRRVNNPQRDGDRFGNLLIDRLTK